MMRPISVFCLALLAAACKQPPSSPPVLDDEPAEAAGTPEENALMTQAFIRDAGKNIQQLVQDQIAQTGENIRIARFARFELGAE